MREVMITMLLIALVCSHQECKGLEDLVVKKQSEVMSQKARARALNQIITDMCDARDGIE